MPPKKKARPAAADLEGFTSAVGPALLAAEQKRIASEGRATQRRLNGYEYENALRDLFCAPWLQVRGQFPDDGEAFRFNRIGDALDVSHVHMARYMSAADYAMRQAMSVQLEQPPTTTKRYYARDQRTLTSKFTGNIFNSSPDRMTYPVVGLDTPQPDVRWLRAPLTDPETRDEEAVAWVSSNYVTGFTYRWDQFRAPVAGRYRIRFSGYTLWVPPGGIQMSFKGEQDKVGKPRPPNKNVGDYDRPQPGRTDEPITVYTRNGTMNRRVGEFDLTPTPAVHDIGEVWLLGNETLVPDASRFYRSRPNNFRNPLMQEDGAPSVAFRWMEVEGPLYDEATERGLPPAFWRSSAPARRSRRARRRGSGRRPHRPPRGRPQRRPARPGPRRSGRRRCLHRPEEGRRPPHARLPRARLPPARRRGRRAAFPRAGRGPPRRRPELCRGHARRLHRRARFAGIRLSRRKARQAR